MFKTNKKEIDEESKIIIERRHKDLDIILENAIKRKDGAVRYINFVLSKALNKVFWPPQACARPCARQYFLRARTAERHS